MSTSDIKIHLFFSYQQSPLNSASLKSFIIDWPSHLEWNDRVSNTSLPARGRPLSLSLQKSIGQYYRPFDARLGETNGKGKWVGTRPIGTRLPSTEQ